MLVDSRSCEERYGGIAASNHRESRDVPSAQSGTSVDYVEMRARPTERVLQSAPDP
jgi:hypothetical protein